MDDERPEKQTVRDIWVQEVGERKAVGCADAVPLYLTLPGAAGRDIEVLIENEMLDLTDVGSVANAEEMKVVAVEQSSSAVVQLQQRFPGLKVFDQPLKHLLKSEGPFEFPRGDHKRFMRAQVVNLDFDKPLYGEVKQGQLLLSPLALVMKIAKLHGDEPQIDWTLCLTLNASLEHWSQEADEMACDFLRSNFEGDTEFSSKALGLLGDELHHAILGDPKSVGIRNRPLSDQQQFLMVLVPKRIARDVHLDGWQMETVQNLRYGGSDGRHPMVTWVFRFGWDTRASTNHRLLYQEALRGSLVNLGLIGPQGELTME